MEYKKGSEWRRWDLHYHTPSSFDVSSCITNNQIIDSLLKREISVVAITDHHKMDVERIKNLHAISNNRLTILPGIEFRSELGGKASVHLTGIFPETSIEKLSDLWTIIAGKLELTPSSITEKGGDDAIYVDFRAASNLIHDMGGIIAVHAGSKSNSIENIKHAADYQRQLKVDLIKDCIDIFETSGADDSEDYKKIVFPNIGIVLPLITCSDTHHRSTDVNRFTWIKADPTFEGLKQIICEPEERVKIQDISPEDDFSKLYFNNIKARGIIITGESVEFAPSDIDLNKNLVAVIGGRGTGKSLLLDSILKSFKTSKIISEDRFSKINPDFFETVFCKADKTQIKTSLLAPEGLSYLHVRQGEIKEIALSTYELSKKIKELLRISYDIDDCDCDLKNLEIIDKIDELKKWFRQKNDSGDFCNTENYCDSAIHYYTSLISNITSENTKEAVANYKINQHIFSQDITQIYAINDKIKEIQRFQDSLNSFINSLNVYFPAEPASTLKPWDFSGIINPLAGLKQKLEMRKDNIIHENEKIKNKLIETGIHQDISTLLEKVDEHQKNLSSFEKHKNSIIEVRNRLADSIVLRNSFIDTVKLKLGEEVINTNTAYHKLKEGKDGWNADQRNLVNSILSDIEISAEVIFDIDVFYNGVWDILNGTKFRDSMHIAGMDKMKRMIGVNSLDDFYSFCKGMPIGTIDDSRVTIDDICEQDFFISNTSYTLYEYIYLKRYYREYLKVIPRLTYKGKPPEKLSVGQRGTFYLCLRLATDPFGSPFVFDQPEDDLDNEFITENLVPIFKKIKKYRQVIIATHNANLVVNADAEQVIVAKNNEEIITFTSGSLENSDIKYNVCRILEGGKDAFMSRENKYGFLNDL